MKTTLLILVIGDSIAHGWAPHLPAEIPAVNCRGTRQYLQATEDGPTNLEVWTGTRHYDVIVFNAGLHDIQQQVPLAEYGSNLRQIVKALRPRCNRLYFCSTTWGRDKAPACTPSAVTLYGAVAASVMVEEKVPVIDLCTKTMLHPEWWKSDYDIHYTEAGYRGMAKLIREAISK